MAIDLGALAIAREVPLIIRPLKPKGPGWIEWDCDTTRWPRKPIEAHRYYNRANEVQVISALENVQERPGVESWVEYHVSVSGVKYGSARPYRISEKRAQWTLREFGLDGSTQDNHVPGGVVRNYWRPIAEPNVGRECPCVETESKITEMKGDYVWRG